MDVVGLPKSDRMPVCRQALCTKSWEQISAALDKLESGNYLTAYARDHLREYELIHIAKRQNAEAGRRIRQALGLPAAAP